MASRAVKGMSLRVAGLVLWAIGAHAAPSFTWLFTPPNQTIVVGTPIFVTASVTNTGNSTITGITGYSATPTVAAGFNGVFGIAGGPTLEQQFAGVNLAPGQVFKFTFFSLNPPSPAAGTVGLRNVALSLRDPSGGTGLIAPSNSFSATTVAPAHPQCRVPVWADEFDGTEVDLSKWSYTVAYEDYDANSKMLIGNRELEYYTARPENVVVRDGKLLLIGLPENYQGAAYTSGELVSKGKGDWLYGRMEARMRLPTAHGMWPADSSVVRVNWGDSSALLGLQLTTPCGEADLQFPVTITTNLLRNGDFADGYRLWSANGPAGVGAYSTISDAPEGFSTAARAEVLKATANPWDVQLIRGGLPLTEGQRYRITFWGRSTLGTRFISASFHDTPQTKTYGSKQFDLEPDWRQYSFEFTVPENAVGQMHVDLARDLGVYDLTGFVFERVR